MIKTKRIISVIILVTMLFNIFVIDSNAVGLLEELFDISFYSFYMLDDNGRVKEESFYNWGSDDKKENGIFIDKVGIDTIKLTINASGNEIYQKCKPVLVWIHQGDSLMDITKYTDIDLWYRNKLEQTFLLTEIPDYTKDSEIIIDVPLKLNIGGVGILNGGFYEVEFYSIDAIPEQLKFAYEAQSYTLEELEEYMQYEMSESIDDYYNVDSGFRSEINGLSFRNSDFEGGGGVCAGIASLTASKYNGYEIIDSYEANDVKYAPTSLYTWYENVYGDESIHEIVLQNNDFIVKSSPSKSGNKNGVNVGYPRQYFTNENENDAAFFYLLGTYLTMNNKTVLFRGNAYFPKTDIKLQNLEHRWSIIDYVASYIRQGKVVTVNLSKSKEGGHSIVGYKMEKIDEDTYRMYCYDSNYPDDKTLKYIGDNKSSELNDDGSYKYVGWTNTDVYIDFTKKTIVGKNGAFSQKEYDVFEFDSSNTSFNVNSSNGVISFSLAQGDKVGIFNYGSESNEIISYKAYPVIKNDNTVEIRTFAYYKSGEVTEITNSINTTVKMDYNFVGWYKIKDSKITLTKKGYMFNDSGSQYIECYVTFDNHTDSFGKLKVRIPVSN